MISGAFYEELPQSWQTFCAKDHVESSEHNRKCYNWISPKGRKYRDWSEVQAYFQLLNFEEDIPGVECRGENVKKNLIEQLGGEPGVTLEEDTKKDADSGKSKEGKGTTTGVKRRRSTVAKVNEDGKAAEPKKRGRRKKDAGDEEEGGADKDKVTPTTEIKTESKPNILDQAMKEATLDEISDVMMEEVDSSQIMTGNNIPEGLKIVNIDPANVKVETPVSSNVVRGQSSSGPGMTKATITPIPPAVNSQTPSKGVGQQPRAPAPAAVRAATPRSAAGAKVRPATPQTGANVRMMTRPSTPGQAPVRPAVHTRPGTPGQTRPLGSTRPQTSVATRPSTPGQVRPMRPGTPQQRPGHRQAMTMTELPHHLRAHVKFACKVESNGGGGGSLYKAVASHLGLPSEGWLALRRYCHTKMAEWWQWYQPYYTFPLQVKITNKSQTIQKRILSPNDFVKFLKTDESLHSFYLSECELYCLANILGATINLLTFSQSASKQDTKWDNYEPHQSLIHPNKYGDKRQPMYCIHELNVQFSRLVR